MAVQIRKLTRKDRKKLSGMIQSLAEGKGMQDLLAMIQRPTDGESAGEDTESTGRMVYIGAEILKMLLDKIEGEFCEWLADLIGVSMEEFDEMAFDVELEIIEQVIETKVFDSFFSRASRLSSTIKRLRGKQSAGKRA